MFTKYSIEEIKEKLKNDLSEERYIHSLGTMEKAVELAQRFGLDVEKAQIAGLLHDCAKCLSKEELKKYENDFFECEKLSAKTWHAPAGAIIIQKDFGVDDKEIISAVRFHTIGKVNMTSFEKVIFLADKIEIRTREIEYREKIEKELYRNYNLDEGMLMSFELTIKSLLQRKLPICYQTIEVYNDLLEKLKI